MRPSLLLPVLLAAALAAGTACRARLSPAELTDPAINARVKAVLKAHPELDIRYLDINTHMREVTISGMVDSHDSRRRIAELARKVMGVRQVMVNVAVQE